MMDGHDSLGAEDRIELADLLRPPSGWATDVALATTFGCDFTAVTACLLALLGSDAQEKSQRRDPDILRALGSLGQRVRIFGDPGSPPRARREAANRFFAGYDDIWVPARPIDGSFHSKLWVVRYEPVLPVPSRVQPARLRLVVASRNLALGTRWELGVCLDGEVGSVATPSSRSGLAGSAIAEFLANALEIPKDDPVARLPGDLRQTVFETRGHAGMRRCEFIGQGGTSGSLAAELGQGTRALVMAPFLKKTFLRELARRYPELTVIGCREDMDRINWDGVLRAATADRLWAVRSVAPSRGSNGDSAEDGEGKEWRALGLHAKLVLTEHRGRGGRTAAATWVGSANGSASAWGIGEPTPNHVPPKNVEAMVRFSPGFAIDSFMDAFVRRGGPDKPLQGWIECYDPPIEPVQPSEEDLARERMDLLVRRIGLLPLDASFDRITSTLVFRSPSAAIDALQAAVGNGTATLLPLSQATSAEAEGRPVADLSTPEGAAFRLDHLAQLTRFALFSITTPGVARAREIAVRARLDLAPDLAEERRRAFLSYLTPETFWEYVRGILGTSSGGGDGGGGGGERGVADHIPPCIEDILIACTADPSRAERMDDLLRSFQGASCVDPGFAEFWTSFQASRRVPGRRLPARRHA